MCVVMKHREKKPSLLLLNTVANHCYRHSLNFKDTLFSVSSHPATVTHTHELTHMHA